VSLREGDGVSLAPADPAPPPAAALLAAVATMKAVSTRVPARGVAALAALAVAIPAGALLAFGPRQDLAALPAAWVASMGALWVAGVALTLRAATWPPRGEVLPDTARGGLTAGLAAATLIGLGLFATVDATGSTILPEPGLAAFARWWWHCTAFALKALVLVLVAGGLLLRRLFPVGAGSAGAAVGAAGGAAAGLALHLICPVGGGLHVGLAHAGAVLLGAALGALLLPLALRTR
jgi:hypothetical protein